MGTGSEALYVYGVVPADTSIDQLDGTSLGMGDGLRLLVAGAVGALVEPINVDRPLGRRRDLLAHSSVLNAMVAMGPVLPMRFGSILHGEEAVVAELLEPQQGRFQALLEEAAGRFQFHLRARYVLDTVLAEIVAAEPAVAELRRRTAGLPEDASHFERIRLGELVAKAVDVRREEDTRRLLEQLVPLAEDYLVREVSGMDSLAELSLLVPETQVRQLERTAELLAEKLNGRVRLSLIGPMALYDFIPEQ